MKSFFVIEKGILEFHIRLWQEVRLFLYPVYKDEIDRELKMNLKNCLATLGEERKNEWLVN